MHVQGAHLVSPLYPALQSAQSLQSASSMDPPKIASRLRSTPAGTMFERPKLGDRRWPPHVIAPLKP